MGDTITLEILGKFQISSDDRMINSEIMRSDMLTKLLVYMIIHRERSVTAQELTEALWEDGKSDNPMGALKNLMYRLRNILDKNLGEADYILTAQGGYSWNGAIGIVVDAEEFERTCESAKKNMGSAMETALYERAVDIYQGDLVSQISDRHWAVSLGAYYHSLYLSGVKRLSVIYLAGKNYENLERLSMQALRYDSVDEEIYCNLIRAMARQKKQKLAMEYYEAASKALRELLGVSRPAGLSEVYRELLAMSKGEAPELLQDVCDGMVEEEMPEGAYICGYPVFREIYRLEARKIARLGVAEFVVLLTLELREADQGHMNEKTGRFFTEQAMKQLEGLVQKSLRIGDVVSRYSDTQYVILLPACTYETSMLVAARLKSRFMERANKRIHLRVEIQEVAMSKESLVR